MSIASQHREKIIFKDRRVHILDKRHEEPKSLLETPVSNLNPYLKSFKLEALSAPLTVFDTDQFRAILNLAQRKDLAYKFATDLFSIPSVLSVLFRFECADDGLISRSNDKNETPLVNWSYLRLR